MRKRNITPPLHDSNKVYARFLSSPMQRIMSAQGFQASWAARAKLTATSRAAVLLASCRRLAAASQAAPNVMETCR